MHKSLANEIYARAVHDCYIFTWDVVRQLRRRPVHKVVLGHSELESGREIEADLKAMILAHFHVHLISFVSHFRESLLLLRSLAYEDFREARWLDDWIADTWFMPIEGWCRISDLAYRGQAQSVAELAYLESVLQRQNPGQRFSQYLGPLAFSIAWHQAWYSQRLAEVSVSRVLDALSEPFLNSLKNNYILYKRIAIADGREEGPYRPIARTMPL